MTTRTRRNGKQSLAERTTISCTFAYSGTTHVLPIDQEVQVVTFNDAPPVSPATGEVQVKSRPHHPMISFKRIKNAFAHEWELDFERHVGVINHLLDSTMETRFGPIYLAPAENNPAVPTSTLAWICGNESTTTSTNPNFNPKPYRYFQGTTNTGVFLGMIDDEGASSTSLQSLRWNGTAMTSEATIVAADTAVKGYYDVEEFQGSLVYLILDGTTEQCWYTTNGDTFTAFTNQPSVNYNQGSRLKALKGLLWLFAYVNGAISVQEQDSPTGASLWTTRSTSGLTGQLRDVEIFRDPDGNDRIFVLTEIGLYYWDETNYEFVQMVVMGTEGRALVPARILGEPVLIVCQDEGLVFAYFENRKPLDISPGGEQGMPSGKDLGPSASSQVCVAVGPKYHYFLFSGLDTGGSAFNPMILALDTSQITEANPHDGWHYIWQKADTSIAAAARFLFYDPQSGDLVGGVQDAVSVDTTLLRFKDIEVNPILQTTWDRQTSGTLTSSRLDFGGPIVSTTIWDMFGHTVGLDANETLAHAYRINGSTGGYTTVATVTADNTRVQLPDNGAATSLGTNCRDMQFRWTVSANAATDVLQIVSIDVGYDRIWPVRYLYVLDVVVKEQAGANMPAPEVVWAACNTIQAALTKGTLVFGNQTVYVAPITQSEAAVTINSLGNQVGTPRTGMRRMVFLES